jgi:hypothetical protein
VSARLHDGWLVVPYSGHDLSRVYIAAGSRPEEWHPAFLDWADGQRVAKIRPPDFTGNPVAIWLKVGESITGAGVLFP